MKFTKKRKAIVARLVAAMAAHQADRIAEETDFGSSGLLG